MVEALEERTLMSASGALNAPLASSATMPAVNVPLKISQAASRLASRGITSILPLKVVGTAVQNGQLVLQGLLGNTPFTAPITTTADPVTQVLNLHLGPIHLDLLGLNVDTSQICLDVTAQSGPGNLLGNLVTDVANALNGGLSLGSILGALSPSDLTTLTNGITGLLGNVFGALASPSAITGASTNILHLAIGPVNLNLLGLNVALDNCAGGPVTLDITATPGPGNLLGNLLGNISHLLDNPSNYHAVSNLLAQLSNILNGVA